MCNTVSMARNSLENTGDVDLVYVANILYTEQIKG